MGSLSNDDGDGNKNGKKPIGLDWQNNNFAHASHLSIHFVAFVAQLVHEFLISHALFMEVGEHKKRISFSSSKLRYGPFGFNPRRFPQH